LNAFGTPPSQLLGRWGQLAALQLLPLWAVQQVLTLERPQLLLSRGGSLKGLVAAALRVSAARLLLQEASPSGPQLLLLPLFPLLYLVRSMLCCQELLPGLHHLAVSHSAWRRQFDFGCGWNMLTAGAAAAAAAPAHHIQGGEQRAGQQQQQPCSRNSGNSNNQGHWQHPASRRAVPTASSSIATISVLLLPQC
jgi:hypothetical protein